MLRAIPNPSAPAGPANATESASTDGLAESLAAILPALERFARFEGPDDAARRTVWRRALDGPLPEEGEGREAVLRLLADVVIPNGLRVGAPGFTGWVTTSPTTVPAVAQLAGSVERVKLTLPGVGQIGPGKIELLRKIAELQSISAAARAMDPRTGRKSCTQK